METRQTMPGQRGGMRMELSHFDEKGNARMVDVSDKDITARTATAEGSIQVSAKAMC